MSSTCFGTKSETPLPLLKWLLAVLHRVGTTPHERTCEPEGREDVLPRHRTPEAHLLEDAVEFPLTARLKKLDFLFRNAKPCPAGVFSVLPLPLPGSRRSVPMCKAPAWSPPGLLGAPPRPLGVSLLTSAWGHHDVDETRSISRC